ncbi:hypothetical protein M7I_5341 [Glarea lozoyensis 74030]|uniref:protein-ribulosamine 3-kinase n=1 Tax=Glarea lozoyensis (strain ATCC 74030 / MF5533) TaxID=1104152 RepID=H0ERM1_GLAL7|nr:hypothetical protein M7I_5341 [Glarea lozoyensis 74030]
MPPKIDKAILSALALDAATTTIASHGGSGFASTLKLTSHKDDIEKLYFVKTGRGKEAGVMFEGEHTSLNAIHNTIPSLCPKSHAFGTLEDADGAFLVTDFLDLKGKGDGLALARKLAVLHTTPAPTPEGCETPVFGFRVPTCCGDTLQDNTFRSSWADFYGENRLQAVLKAGEKKHGIDTDLRNLVERMVEEVVPRLLGDGHLKDAQTGRDVRPVVVHGDLWSGNWGRTREGEEVVFDAAGSYAHGEFEWGIMRMFGGFGGEFEGEYWKERERRGGAG